MQREDLLGWDLAHLLLPFGPIARDYGGVR